jgi:hypothetical protein
MVALIHLKKSLLTSDWKELAHGTWGHSGFRGLSQISGVDGSSGMMVNFALRFEGPMILVLWPSKFL